MEEIHQAKARRWRWCDAPCIYFVRNSASCFLIVFDSKDSKSSMWNASSRLHVHRKGGIGLCQHTMIWRTSYDIPIYLWNSKIKGDTLDTYLARRRWMMWSIIYALSDEMMFTVICEVASWYLIINKQKEACGMWNASSRLNMHQKDVPLPPYARRA